jgi:hypothetical protein
MKRIILVVLVCLGFLMSDCVIANDSIGALGLGGIEFKKTKDISMEKETLTISNDQVRVEYEFINNTDKPIRETVVFPMPVYNYYKAFCQPSPEYMGSVQDFKVWVDGKQLMPSLTVRARIQQHADAGKQEIITGYIDVTDRLKKLGFTDEDIAEYRGITFYSGECDNDDDLYVSGKYQQNLELLNKEGLANKKHPLWDVSYVYHWEQEFPPKQITHVVHEYEPFAGGGSGEADFMGSSPSFQMYNPKDFCMTDGAIRAARQIQKRTTQPFRWSVVDYILTTGANWSGPIKDFTLNLKKMNANEIVTLCFDGHFKKQDALTLTSNIKNFTPQKDISVLFYYDPDAEHADQNAIKRAGQILLPH